MIDDNPLEIIKHSYGIFHHCVSTDNILAKMFYKHNPLKGELLGESLKKDGPMCKLSIDIIILEINKSGLHICKAVRHG